MNNETPNDEKVQKMVEMAIAEGKETEISNNVDSEIYVLLFKRLSMPLTGLSADFSSKVVTRIGINTYAIKKQRRTNLFFYSIFFTFAAIFALIFATYLPSFQDLFETLLQYKFILNFSLVIIALLHLYDKKMLEKYLSET